MQCWQAPHHPTLPVPVRTATLHPHLTSGHPPSARQAREGERTRARRGQGSRLAEAAVPEAARRGARPASGCSPARPARAATFTRREPRPAVKTVRGPGALQARLDKD